MRQFTGKTSGRVNASKVTDITLNEGAMKLDDGGQMSKSKEWSRQNKPQVGDWYVEDESGANARIMADDEFKAEFEQVPDTLVSRDTGPADRTRQRDERAKAAGERARRAEGTPQATQERENRQREQQAAEESDRVRRERLGVTKEDEAAQKKKAAEAAKAGYHPDTRAR